MAFLGDIGKVFLGGATTADVGGAVGGYLGGPIGSKVGYELGGDIAGKFKKQPTMNGTQQGQSVAKDTGGYYPASETSQSGVIGYSDMYGGGFENVYAPQAPQAGYQNVLLPQVLGGARSLYGLLFGGAVAGAPMIFDSLTGREKKLRVTRKLKRDVTAAVKMMGIERVAEAMGVTTEVVEYILFKKMRNDGAYVTKAAVRKTRQTIRKLDHMCELRDMCAPKAKRRAPVRRKATAGNVITQVK
jgi:hypothetical protein